MATEPDRHKNRFEGDTVRLNRKWLYLGGLVTIMTLLLTLTLALPAGAVGQLDPGNLSTDDGYVSPSDDGDAMIEVTLSNSGLDITQTVEKDGDFGPVTLTVADRGISAVNYSSVTVDLLDGGSTGGLLVVALDDDVMVADVLPITGDVSIDYGPRGESSVTSGQVGSPTVRNRADGIIEFPINANLVEGDTIVLSFETSPQETGLLNVSGDSGNFDLLAVEDPAGPSGDYSATVMASEAVTISMTGGIVHEQHPVPSGLSGYVEVDDEEITKFYTDATTSTTHTIPDGGLPSGSSLYVQVAKPPIRNDNFVGVTIDHSALRIDTTTTIADGGSNARTGLVKLDVEGGNFNDDDIEISYFGSDSFYIEVNHGPIQYSDMDTDITIVVPMIDTDDDESPMDKLQIISIGDGVDDTCQDCRVRLGVVTPPTKGDEPTPLYERISVLGISYDGSERISVSDGLVGSESDNNTFTATLDFDPASVDGEKDDDGEDIVDPDDIDIVGMAGLDATPTVVSVDNRNVTFRVAARQTATVDATIDVAYSLRVGANPRNALLPGAREDDGNYVGPIIAVSAGSRVAFTSDNDRATVDAEVDGPVFSNPSPSHKGATDDDAQEISIDVTDELAGVDQDTIELRVSVGGAASLEVPNEDLSFSEITGGYRASVFLDEIDDVPNINASETTAVEWSATAKDNAGNSADSDVDADKDGDQNYVFNVDGENPAIMRAYTGDWFDDTTDKVKGDRRVGVDDYLPGSSDNTSLRVIFNERVNGDSISADDFSVDGAAPTAAGWYGEGDDGDSDDDTHIGQSVFLTVPAMAAESTPTVRIVGSVSDVAGNATSSGTKEAADGIAPTATLSVDKTLSDKKVTVTVETDERIRTLSPDLDLYISNGPKANDESDVFTVENEDPDDSGSPLVLRDAAGNDLHSSGEIKDDDRLILRLSKAPILDGNGDGEVDHEDVVVSAGLVTEVTEDGAVNAKTGEVKVMVDKVGGLVKDDKITVTYRGTDPDPARGLPDVPNPSGRQVSATSWTFVLNVSRNDRYAATATAEDSSRNKRTGGIPDPTAAGATVFEIDSMLAGGESAETMPQHDAAGNLPVSITNPFVIELSWDGEKNEYPGDSSSAVTLTKAELDGDDVLDTAASQNDRSYRLSILDIGLGDHVLKYNAEDALGNTNAVDRVLRFTVQAVPTWDLELSAGMNLISLPADPASTSVNDLFGDTEQIELVFTFDGGQSLVALRNADAPGTFVGTLDRIDSQHAYWVSSSNAAKVEINIPPTSQLAPPPYIAVTGGQWNLLPVISLEPVDAGAAPGTEIDADAYLGDFRTAFGWNGRSWSKIDPDPAGDDRLTTGPTVKIGMGYWVLYDEDAIITP